MGRSNDQHAVWPFRVKRPTQVALHFSLHCDLHCALRIASELHCIALRFSSSFSSRPFSIMPKLPDLRFASYEDIKSGLNAAHFTSLDLVTAYLARIQEVNPTLKPILEINAYAALEASRLDQQRQKGESLGQTHLHGMPIVCQPCPRSYI